MATSTFFSEPLRAGAAACVEDVRGPEFVEKDTFRKSVLIVLALSGALLSMPSFGSTEAEPDKQLHAIEADLPGFPARAEVELDEFFAQARATDAKTRRFAGALLGQARVAAGHMDTALQLADQLEREGKATISDATLAIAWLIRSNALVAGDVPRANLLANNARTLAQNATDAYARFWAAMEVGITARMLGQYDEALTRLREAYALADAAQNPYRRANALYQLSVLHRATRKAESALDESKQAFIEAQQAGSTYGMAKAKMAESAALEILNEPVRELAAMQEALAIARKAGSNVEESLALINLADIHLRRKNFRAALEMSRQSLELATRLHDGSLIATNKANMGFALFGLGRMKEGKRLAEDALTEYERTGASADIADLLGEYAQHLADVGDYKGALALHDRQQKVFDKILNAARQRDLRELQSKFDSERRIDRIELLNRESEQRFWWLLALMSLGSLTAVAMLYRRVRITNSLLARRNEELGFHSVRDPLTSLYNRRHFQNFINEKPAETDRRRGAIEKPVQAILLIDLDHFKSINDQFGHAAGDAALIAVAQRLRDALRETDMIVRWGGEEFLVFVPVAPCGELAEIVQRVLRAISAEPINFREAEFRVTVSIGYAPMLLPPDDVALGWERVLELADWALYVAKRRGRNRACGVVSFKCSGSDAPVIVEGDLERAWNGGIVDASELFGASMTATAPFSGAPRAQQTLAG
jgi:diguanylate cyclase (GGDEF)-like protein